MERTFELELKPNYDNANLNSHADVSANYSMAYMTAVLRQMAEFADYAVEVFDGVKVEIERVDQRVQELTQKSAELLPQIEESQQSVEALAVSDFITNPLIEWHASFPQRVGRETNFITARSRPAFIEKLRSKCEEPPPLHLLKPFVKTEEDAEALTRFSDPKYCIRAFAIQEMQEAERIHAARREKRRLRREKMSPGDRLGKRGSLIDGISKVQRSTRRRYSMIGLSLMTSKVKAIVKNAKLMDDDDEPAEDYVSEQEQEQEAEVHTESDSAFESEPLLEESSQSTQLEYVPVQNIVHSPLQPATIQIQTRPQARPPPPPAHLLKKLSGKTHTPVLVSPKPYAFQSRVNYSQAEDHVMLAHPPRNNLATVQSEHGIGEVPSASSSPHVASPDWRSPVPLYHTQAAPSSTERVLPESFFTPVKEPVYQPNPTYQNMYSNELLTIAQSQQSAPVGGQHPQSAPPPPPTHLVQAQQAQAQAHAALMAQQQQQQQQQALYQQQLQQQQQALYQTPVAVQGYQGHTQHQAAPLHPQQVQQQQQQVQMPQAYQSLPLAPSPPAVQMIPSPGQQQAPQVPIQQAASPVHVSPQYQAAPPAPPAPPPPPASAPPPPAPPPPPPPPSTAPAPAPPPPPAGGAVMPPLPSMPGGPGPGGPGALKSALKKTPRTTPKKKVTVASAGGGDLASMIKAKQKNLQKTPARAPQKVEPRDDMLNKIKGGQFALRKMTRSFNPKGLNVTDSKLESLEEVPEEEDKTMMTVAAIYEKAKARRLAMECSDSEEDEDYDSEDDDW